MREWIYAGAVLILSGCGGGDDPGNGAGSHSTGAKGTIAEWILEDYPDNSLIIGSDKSDPTYGKFKGLIPRVNQEKNQAAEIAAKKCKQVESVLFMRQESTVDNFKYMVDCESGKRYEITTKDIASGASVSPNSEKAIGRSDALDRCKKLVQARHPGGRLEFHEISGSSYYKAKNGNVRLLLGFQEVSLAGNKTSWRASCVFDTDWKGELSISSD